MSHLILTAGRDGALTLCQNSLKYAALHKEPTTRNDSLKILGSGCRQTRGNVTNNILSLMTILSNYVKLAIEVPWIRGSRDKNAVRQSSEKKMRIMIKKLIVTLLTENPLSVSH